MDADKATKLEELLAHQQRLLDELNAELTALRGEFDALAKEHTRLKATTAKLVEFQEGAEDRPGEKPPHY